MEAFKLNVADYIVRPVTISRFMQAVNRARELIQSATEEFDLRNEEFIFKSELSYGIKSR